jgi:drug/metabolite transporter (DMT)-like permease
MAHGLAHAPLPGPAEQAFAARTYAVNRFGIGGAHLRWLGDGFAAFQVAEFQTVSGALGGAADAVPAAREAMIAATVLTAAALGVAVLGERLTGAGQAGAAALLAGLALLAAPRPTAVHR